VIGREESVDQRPDSQLERTVYELGKPKVENVTKPSWRCSQITNAALGTSTMLNFYYFSMWRTLLLEKWFSTVTLKLAFHWLPSYEQHRLSLGWFYLYL